jgi:allantoate deiminase
VTTSTKAAAVVECCRVLAGHSELTGATLRTFLSPPMRAVHAHLTAWMERTGMHVTVDAAGNLRGLYPAATVDAPRLFIGSHLDTVAHAGAFDGVLGVVLAIVLVESLDRRALPFAIEVVGFSEEEGVRFGVPFIGSRALAGMADADLLARRDAQGRTVAEAIHDYGLDPSCLGQACAEGEPIGYLEFHIEQGPILDRLGVPLGIVDAIVGQSRRSVTFTGAANHAGTTPMDLRRDALAGAAEWITLVESIARHTTGLRATVGRLQVSPDATNVIPGSCELSLDVRHADDRVRTGAAEQMLRGATGVAAARRLEASWVVHLDQPSVAMDPGLVASLERAVRTCGFSVQHLDSGAGHDAMILATRMPAAMLFLRSPGGISHHPDESVIEDDVAAALAVGRAFLHDVAEARR